MTKHRCWQNDDNAHMDRRSFMRLTAAGALGAAAGSLALPTIARAAGTSTVVCVKGAGVMSGAAPNAEMVMKMLEKALLSFTGKTSLTDAWKEFVSPKDKIGLKINCLGRAALSTHPVLTEAVIKSLVAAGMDENNIIVWDRFGDQMQDAGYPLKGGTGVKYLASENAPETVGYDESLPFEGTAEQIAKTPGPSYLAKLLTKETTAMINLPVMKNHVLAGVTLGLKNVAFGVTGNNGRLHTNNCDPFIPEVCAMPQVKEKTRLTILDAIEACYEGGPYPRNPNFKWRPELLYVATDMVAMDAIAAQVIDAKRREKGLPPAMLKSTHIATAAKMKLGTNVKDEIKVENITI